ncbi:GDP-mannose mannosyl hydrolase [Pectobacterium carotovorum subsp. carotovorum]|nr:GDP-mannose mannosyl hydrolase [Pectobacterium versatile]KAA3667473.1 GDP-mannose mannosyl hydrolase [Pectobacterium carotovorum subsp. carotovorum]MCH5081944.1 GDP-mannose mannosyl hydrolase [Pectobacterium versatile]
MDNDSFSFIINNTPLISIDIMVVNSDEDILLGKRKNQPAKGYWFVPGGRILKSETLEGAFARLTHDELGTVIPFDQAEFQGVYEHFYENSYLDDNISTHYVVLLYKVKIREKSMSYPQEQHQEYIWLSREEITINEEVHSYTKNYFQ